MPGTVIAGGVRLSYGVMFASSLAAVLRAAMPRTVNELFASKTCTHCYNSLLVLLSGERAVFRPPVVAVAWFVTIFCDRASVRLNLM